MLIDSKMLAYFSKTAGNSFDSYHAIISSVAILPLSRRPHTVFRIVSLAVVSSLKREIYRLLSHVFQEASKRAPSFTDFYSSAAVVWIAFFIRIRAALKHSCPRLISRAALARRAVSVSVISFVWHKRFNSTVFASSERLTAIRRSLRFLHLQLLRGQSCV